MKITVTFPHLVWYSKGVFPSFFLGPFCHMHLVETCTKRNRRVFSFLIAKHSTVERMSVASLAALQGTFGTIQVLKKLQRLILP